MFGKRRLEAIEAVKQICPTKTNHPGRFLRQLTGTRAAVLAGGEGTRLRRLNHHPSRYRYPKEIIFARAIIVQEALMRARTVALSSHSLTIKGLPSAFGWRS